MNDHGQISAYAFSFGPFAPFGVNLARIVSPKMNVKLTFSRNPSVGGVAVTLTATITSAQGYFPPNVDTVTFKDGSVVLGKRNLSKTGVAVLAVSLQPGTHSIQVFYSGGEYYAASKSFMFSK